MVMILIAVTMNNDNDGMMFFFNRLAKYKWA